MKLFFFPLFALVGCSTQPVSHLQVEDKVIKLTPPVEFTQPTSIPSLNGDDNESLSFWILDLKGAINNCNTDKKKIIEWSKQNAP